MKITIDGPAGSGKSTVARELSVRLNLPYLETGTAYRAAGYLLLRGKGENFSLSWEDLKSLLTELEIIPMVGETVVKVGGKRLEGELRDERVGKMASLVGTVKEFREYINELFRSVIGERQAVVEGRDAGTNIFPDAELKLFITATPEERARRRYEQLKKLGKTANYDEILTEIIERDKRDMEREIAPLKPAPDAVIIDTTGRSVEEVLSQILELIKEKV
ncbi:cytidylate kinase [Hydrogenivirga caldilitoris]|uniref:Cytidylate kinase n=1 Tax=Hydrogenivirga caldilitoris TaxID=246264 RepID=A0A497XSU7_9AQUI|nr:(d)CMP kinase [Hydrogenivirga caldilitoris]RLJ71374.1 cytidylate kinase [Hydrogenivirga caldilitoris]